MSATEVTSTTGQDTQATVVSGDPIIGQELVRVDRTVIARAAEFRRMVLQAYRGRCVICGGDAKVAHEWFVEAGHVIPKAAGGPDVLENGICFCPNHHWAFDRGLIGIDHGGTVRVAAIARRSAGKLAALFKGIDGSAAIRPSKLGLPAMALHWHWENVFRLSSAAAIAPKPKRR